MATKQKQPESRDAEAAPAVGVQAVVPAVTLEATPERPEPVTPHAEPPPTQGPEPTLDAAGQASQNIAEPVVEPGGASVY